MTDAVSTPTDEESIRSLVAESGGVVIFTATYYESTTDLRFRLCTQTIAESVKEGLPLVIVDGSRSKEVRSALEGSGAIVRAQAAKGRKGAALREAASIASALPGVESDTLLCWQEPEKVGMIRLWREVRKLSSKIGSDVVVPWRDSRCFCETYPIEQFHSETFGNMYLDAVLKESGRNLPLVLNDEVDNGHDGEKRGVDWHFGPFSFLSKHIHFWTAYQGGDSYDAQLVPIVHSIRRGLTASSISVKYRAPQEMKQEEEGDVLFIEKRLWQLNDLDPRVKKAWTEDFYC